MSATFSTRTTPQAEHALRGVIQLPFWLDGVRPDPQPPVTAATSTDLAVVGGGYTGLWTALLAKQADPDRDVLLVEARRLGWAASGRNGGFCSASLTHGADNGRLHLPAEADRLEQLGQANLDAIEDTVDRLGWQCSFERTGIVSVATEPYQLPAISDAEGFLDRDAVRAQVDSPTYLGGVWDKRENALVNPAQLVWELRRTCLEVGVRIAEGTPVRSLSSDSGAVTLHTDRARIRARHVALGTNAFPSLLRRHRWHTIPVYDYALMTEPLSSEQLAAIGWRNRQGMEDLANRFHYYRLTDDNRVLFGGFDAVYHFGRRMRPEYDHRRATYLTLATHFLQTFPQLDGIRFTHAWGGAVDACSRFFPFFGTGHAGRVASAAGYTGLGVGATRFAAQVLLDLLSGRPTELTELAMVRRRPLPFPPEPLAWLGIQATTRSLARADGAQGRRGMWLRGLDALGMGFDS